MNACVLMWTKRSGAIFVQVTEFNQIIYGICGNFSGYSQLSFVMQY